MSTESLMKRARRHNQKGREWQERFAARHSFFWLPCPLCGEPFSGAEWGDSRGRRSDIVDPTNSTRRKGICPSCTQAGLGKNVSLQEAITRVLAIVEPIVEAGKGKIGTHSDRCYEYHAGCLAVLVRDILMEGQA